jgi:hypothetical protein
VHGGRPGNSLVGSDQFARHVEGEPPLVVGLHAFREIIVGDREAVPAGGGKQIIDRHPTARLEREPEFVRGMSQVLRQVLAEPNEAIVHGRISRNLSPSAQSSEVSTS